MTSSSPPNGPRQLFTGVAQLPVLHLLIFFSGVLALVYEVLWMRRFTTVFGATTPAIAAILSAVFLGLAAGSAIVGSRAARWSRPLRAYGILEIVIGLSAALVEPALRLFDAAYPALYGTLHSVPGAFTAVKVMLAVVVLFVPTCCMGGTVPLLANGFDRRGRQLGVSAGGLYAVNTLGAALGAISVPFLWLPNLSAQTSYLACVSGSVMVGVLALILDSRSTVNGLPLPAPSRAVDVRHPVDSTRISAGRLLTFGTLSGFLIFVLQVVWSRMFAQVHENSIYSFALVVSVLLLGLAAGAGVSRWWLNAKRDPAVALAFAWIAGGVVVIITPSIFFASTNGLTYVEAGRGWAAYGMNLLALAVPSVFVPTLMTGMVLPILMELAGRNSTEVSSCVIGRLLAWNTTGSILGSLVAAFLLPSTLGMWGSLIAVGVVMVVAGEWSLRASVVRRAVLASGIVIGLVLMNPFQIPRTKFRSTDGERLLATLESSHGIVAVVEQGASRRIKLNNYYVLGGTASTGDERIQAHLPLLLHPAPKRVAFLGLGTGITAGAALLHTNEQVVAVELVPDVIRAAAEHFKDANLGVIDSPKVQVLADDARSFVRGSEARFDVIVGDLFVPWHRGESSLYTAEHFAACRRALAPGGLFCQWLPLFQLSEEEFNIVTATFIDVFPRATLWRGDFAPTEPAIALIGHREADATIVPSVVAQRVAATQRDDANPMLMHPAGVWMFLAGPLDPTAERFARARRNRDDEPWLEILGPLQHAGSSKGQVPLFVGRRLEQFVEQLRQAPVKGTPLASLGENEISWRGAGAKLAEVSNLTIERRGSEVPSILDSAVRALPPELRPFFGGAPNAAPRP